jgi:aminopeptidase-like protein
MFKPVLKALEKEISGAIALSYVAEVAKHHRIQASPGIRAACEYALSEFHKMGVDAKLHSYPANGQDFDWTSLRFKEWSCDDAWLKLVEPEEKYLARFAEKKIHVIQRSISTPEGGLTANVMVPLNKGEEPEDYDGIKVEGKVVITNGDVHRVHELAVVERGAAGIIFDGMFVRSDLPEGTLDDTLKYTSFWWTPQDTPGLGWVVTPRTGRELRRLVAKGDPVKVHGHIKSELYDGYLDSAVATIPGETDEEVIVIAHICHPEPSANDNASGCGAAMEAARAIKKLIDDGVLKKPKRTIRFTLVPEMTGSYSYLVEREEDIPKMVASINLDMVGEDQGKTGSVLVLHKTPDSFPSYINAVSEAIFEEIQKEFKSIGGNPWMATFRHAVGEFSGGSDHYIYTDPTVGIPSVMMIQWPDKFYHTSDDTIDKVSPKSLAKVATIAATFAYFMANAGEKEAPWIASQVASREKQALSKMVQRTLDRAAVYDVDAYKVDEVRDYLKEKIEFDVEVGIEALRSIKRIAPGCESTINPLISNLMAEAEEEYNHAMKILEDLAEKQGITELPDYEHEVKDEPEGSDQVPVKLYRGPLSSRPWLRSLSPEDQEALRQLNKKHGITYSGPSTQALYWTDGSRSISEISRLVELETEATNLPYLVEYYGFLVRSGRAEYQNRARDEK